MNIRLAATCFIATAALLGCRDGGGGAETSATGDATASYEAAAPAEPSDAAVEARSRAALEQRLAEIDSVVQRLPGLIGSIRQDMRQHLNATHVAAARSNGVGPVRDRAHLATLVDRGALVQLPESTHWWVLRDLNYSRPYVTPGTQAALEEVGRRFHARLDEHGLPPFRLDITSVLRTSDQQSALQRRNPNAAGTTSSHEFGTTLDIAYLSFAAPQSLDHSSLATELDDQVSPSLRAEMTTRLDSLGTLHAPHLEGELGAVLQQLERDGMVLPLRERGQPVYHITVARDP
jgi:D-alanyl-D-alanine dipeptidase